MNGRVAKMINGTTRTQDERLALRREYYSTTKSTRRKFLAKLTERFNAKRERRKA